MFFFFYDLSKNILTKNRKNSIDFLFPFICLIFFVSKLQKLKQIGYGKIVNQQ